MLIICKKYPLAGLLASEGTKDVTQGLIPAVADIKKIVWQSRVNEAKTIMILQTIWQQKKDLALTTYTILLLQQMARFFFACQPDDGKDVCNAIQAVVDTWLIFEKKDGGA